MAFLTVDLETYYDREYSLSKMTTEAYINDPRFQVIGVSVKTDDAETYWFSGTHAEIKDFLLRQADWNESAVLCHNQLFDGTILKWIFGIQPAFYYDTLCMARALHSSVEVGGSLKALASFYKIGEKGDEIIKALGKRREDFSKEELERYGAYCCNDTELTYKLFNKMATNFPDPEHQLINLTLRMFIDPALTLDDAMLVSRLEEVKIEKSVLLSSLMSLLKCATEEEVRKKLASNKQFAGLLMGLGAELPKKISPATGKETFAFAKSDVGFIALESHENPQIQQLCAVRLGTKSTLEEKRIGRFIDIGGRNKGLLPIPLKYYGAHTGRWSGTDKINLQNLPSRDKNKKTLKNSIVAPAGHVIINADSSQIEARILAWLAGQDDVVKAFAENRDVYCEDASKVYDRTITNLDVAERFVGKTCIGLGSMVLCKRGWVPIEQVGLTDRVWDGEEWVDHEGVIYNGLKQTLQILGLWLTPDHTVWSGTKWLPAASVVGDVNILSRALAIAAENLPLQAICAGQKGLMPLLLDATVADQSIQLIHTTSKILNLRDATYVLLKQQLKNAIGGMQKLCQMTSTELDYLIGWQRLLQDATPRLQIDMNITVSEEYPYQKSGGRIGRHSLGIFRLCRDGISQIYRWIGKTITEIIPPATSSFLRELKTCLIVEKLQILKKTMPVYDLLSCGPRNRFTVLTGRGPLIVHNCRLGLGYGTGATKLRHMLKVTPPGADLTDTQCETLVRQWRRDNKKIVNLWLDGGGALDFLMTWPQMGTVRSYGKHGCVKVLGRGFHLPNGLFLIYPKLRVSGEARRTYIDKYQSRTVYDSREGPHAIWGGAVAENITQALARIVVGEQMLALDDTGLRTALTVHDSIGLVVPIAEADDAVAFIRKTMSTPPSWAPGLPLSCSIKVAESYGEC